MKKDKAFEQEKRRTLTPAEEKRLRRFEALCAEMERKGYRKCGLTVGIVRANVLTMVMAVPICAAAVLLFRRLNPGSGYGMNGTQMILWLVGMLVLTAVHDHSLCQSERLEVPAKASQGKCRWYDANGGQTVDPGLTITVGAIENGACTVTIG